MTSINDIILSLIPSTSNYKGSDLEEVLEASFNSFLEEFQENSILDAYNSFFERLAEAEALDRLGELYGIKRHYGESDEDYRRKIIFHADKMISEGDLEELGCTVVEYEEDYDTENMLLADNIIESSRLLIICPTQEIYDLVSRNIFIGQSEVVLDDNQG